MAKPVIDYELNVRIKGEDKPPSPTAIARTLREALQSQGYDVTIRARVREDEPV